MGASGLWLEWGKSDVTVFFGCEIFYHLGYINEAYRWAFEAMVAKGQCPRLMKRLIITSFINNNNAIAEKYLNIMDQTLFYSKWAHHYRNYLQDSTLLLQDKEITGKQHLSISADFNAVNNLDYILIQLLKNHPDNQMAFEYYMASLLLDKNVTAFAANIYRIKDFGYKEIPVHFEEALIVYMYYAKKNIIPEGYMIRESTIKRFNDYSNAYSLYSANIEQAAKSLYQSYGNTYWFYLHFINNQIKIR
jgi:hypothetical protein